MVFTKQNCKYMQRNSFWDWCKISHMKCTLYNSILFWNEMNFRFFCHQDTNKRKKHHRFYVTQHILCIIFCRQISFCYIKFSHIPQTYTFMVRLWKFHEELQRLYGNAGYGSALIALVITVGMSNLMFMLLLFCSSIVHLMHNGVDRNVLCKTIKVCNEVNWGHDSYDFQTASIIGLLYCRRCHYLIPVESYVSW